MKRNQIEMEDSNGKISIPIKTLAVGVSPPNHSRPGDAGADARIIGFKKIVSKNGKKELIDVHSDSYTLKSLELVGCSLGFSTAIPEGYYFKVVPRSGFALEGLSIVNSPGTIDSGYRNEWIAIVINLSNKKIILKKRDRICQIILAKMYEYEFIEMEELPNSERGLEGFGSTGKK
ncbi:MAG: dUTP diphosphatase [Promethearchaeota archaeon]